MGLTTPRDDASRASSHSGNGRTYPSRRFKSPAGVGAHGTPVPPQVTPGGPSSPTKGKGGSPNAGPTHKMRKHLNLAAVQMALQENDDGVESMKREVSEYQEYELKSAYDELIVLRKTHDRLYQDADAADVAHRQVCEELSQLERLAGVGGMGGKGKDDPVEMGFRLERKIAATRVRLKASTEQNMVFAHMLERLKAELLGLQKKDNETKGRQSSLGHDLQSGEIQKQQAETELRVEEEIISDRQVLQERQLARNKKKEEIMTKADMGVDEEQKLKRMNVIRQLYTTILEKKMSDDEEQLASLENTFHQLRNVTGLSNVEEVVEKFLSRNEKNSQLQAVAEDLKKRIQILKEDNLKSKVGLDDIIARTENNASNRKVYLEVIRIDVHVGSASKMCEESKARATRLSVTIGELRETVARFLSKVKNDLESVPTVKDLPEKMHELDLSLTEMMKIVSANLAKKGEEGGAEDDGGSPEGAKGGANTFSKLAGPNLGRIMYHKLMTTDPDQSPRNVRVTTKMNMVQLSKQAQRSLLDPEFEALNPPPSAARMFSGPGHSAAYGRQGGMGEEEEDAGVVVDRTTVKKLANMV
ncbi:hypothetical protein TrRE_jg1473, partial [Triparma retinervis]